MVTLENIILTQCFGKVVIRTRPICIFSSEVCVQASNGGALRVSKSSRLHLQSVVLKDSNGK